MRTRDWSNVRMRATNAAPVAIEAVASSLILREEIALAKAEQHLRLLFVQVKIGESRLFTLCHRAGKKSALLLGVCKSEGMCTDR